VVACIAMFLLPLLLLLLSLLLPLFLRFLLLLAYILLLNSSLLLSSLVLFASFPAIFRHPCCFCVPALVDVTSVAGAPALLVSALLLEIYVGSLITILFHAFYAVAGITVIVCPICCWHHTIADIPALAGTPFILLLPTSCCCSDVAGVMNVADFSVFDDIPAFIGVFASIGSIAIDGIPAIDNIPAISGVPVVASILTGFLAGAGTIATLTPMFLACLQLLMYMMVLLLLMFHAVADIHAIAGLPC
jgi:hypothetical protein